MDNTQKDKLQRPYRDKEIGRLPLPSDILVASGSRRCIAFLVDIVIVVFFAAFMVKLALTSSVLQPDTNSTAYLLRTLIIATASFWGAYTVAFTISPLKGTIGQVAMRIYIVSYFGKRLTASMAFWRYLIFISPMLLFSLAFPEDIASQIPYLDWQSQNSVTTELFYPLLMATVFCQFILAWPILTGNVTRVWWDEIVRCCVLKRNIDKNIA